jgi:hypothetical protein
MDSGTQALDAIRKRIWTGKPHDPLVDMAAVHGAFRLPCSLCSCRGTCLRFRFLSVTSCRFPNCTVHSVRLSDARLLSSPMSSSALVLLGQFLGGVCVASKKNSAVYFSIFFSKVA